MKYSNLNFRRKLYALPMSLICYRGKEPKVLFLDCFVINQLHDHNLGINICYESFRIIIIYRIWQMKVSTKEPFAL